MMHFVHLPLLMVGCVGLPVFSLSPDYLPYEHVLPCLTHVTPLKIQLRINKVCHVIVRLGISTRRIDKEPIFKFTDSHVN